MPTTPNRRLRIVAHLVSLGIAVATRHQRGFDAKTALARPVG
jgi:hypothetical protein